MKIGLEGRYLEDIKPLLEEEGFVFSKENPEIIITHGGDGALLGAERNHPGVPKFPIRDKKTAPLCSKHCYKNQIQLLKNGLLKQSRLIKIAGLFNDKKLVGINDVFIHNKDIVSALRYRVWINDVLYADEIVGDGVGVATVHGSTAYYRSITHSIFRVGIGLAFSNSTELINHLVLPEDSVVRAKIIRGPALLAADNSPDCIELAEGDEVIVRKTSDYAEIYGLDIFMCPDCRLLRHPRSRPFSVCEK